MVHKLVWIDPAHWCSDKIMTCKPVEASIEQSVQALKGCHAKLQTVVHLGLSAREPKQAHLVFERTDLH